MRGDRRLPITAPWIDPNQANPISFSAAVFFVPRERTSPRTKCHSRPNATRGAPVETGLRVLSSRTSFQTESRQSAEDVCKSRDVNPKLEGIVLQPSFSKYSESEQSLEASMALHDLYHGARANKLLFNIRNGSITADSSERSISPNASGKTALFMERPL